jgi:ClpP class serine protease
VLAALEILAGYEQPLAGSGSVGVHRMTEALKHAFALRMSLGVLLSLHCGGGSQLAAAAVSHQFA